MIVLIIQTVLLLAIALILGCLVGALLRWLFGGSGAKKNAETPNEAKTESKDAVAPIQTATSAEAASQNAALTIKAPHVPSPPMPGAKNEKAAVSEKSKQARPEKKPVEKAKSKPAKIASAPKPGAKTKAKASTGEADDLKKISGVGPVIEKKLNALGVTTFAQIAAWDADAANKISENLNFKGRIERENWISQAQELASKAEN